MSYYKTYRHILMSLDPVHIGTGGYRLGRVDLSIAREPGTLIPKIPGTSLSGAMRQYAALKLQQLSCAGKGGVQEETRHCGRPTCPICYSFGFARGEEGGSSGAANIFDAQILFFPVHSMEGPIWLTTIQRLRAAEFSYELTQNNAPVIDYELADGEILTTMAGTRSFNLGWLMMDRANHNGQAVSLKLTPPQRTIGNTLYEPFSCEAWDVIKNRIAIATEKVFSQVVNSNLEIRTSVSIDPFTGAAEEHALFTYEAIPRATWFMMDIVIDDFVDAFPSSTKLSEWRATLNNDGKIVLLKNWHMKIHNHDAIVQSTQEALVFIANAEQHYVDSQASWSSVHSVLCYSFRAMEALGVGGMGTRGFGRLRNINSWEA